MMRQAKAIVTRKPVTVLAIVALTNYWLASSVTLVIAQQDTIEMLNATLSADEVEDSFYDAFTTDPSCNVTEGSDQQDCFFPPESTIETKIDATCLKGPEQDPDDDEENDSCPAGRTINEVVDLHWGKDPSVLHMRNQLRWAGAGASQIIEPKETLSAALQQNKRPPIVLLPGLASTRLVAWKFKKCFASEIKVQDNVWLNLNLVVRMGTIDVDCMKECLQLGRNQTDTDDLNVGCKLRPDEGLDAIASLAPGGLGSSLLVGGTNTVYAWLIQWLSDNLGYDVTNIVGLPYDWRLSPDKMQDRDGFLTLMRKRMEAAVATNGYPAIVVAHSMGNIVFRYFLAWLRIEIRRETFHEMVRGAERAASNPSKARVPEATSNSSTLPGWMTASVAASGLDELYRQFSSSSTSSEGDSDVLRDQLKELSRLEGDQRWMDWLQKHVWTYVGLSAPMLGAVNPLRAVLSGENMGLPITDQTAREMELSFGSTHTINPVSTTTGFCDFLSDDPTIDSQKDEERRLACLEEIARDIENSSNPTGEDPWKNFPALKSLLRDRVDWDSDKPVIDIEFEHCEDAKKGRSCVIASTHSLSALHAQNGTIFTKFAELWKERGDPLLLKHDQLRESFWNDKVPNILNQTWDRPLIKHVFMGYGVDYPTESGYVYKKTLSRDGEDNEPISKDDKDNVPHLKGVLWEVANGELNMEYMDSGRGGITDVLIKKKPRRKSYKAIESKLAHSGDGSVPYLSLSWVHTWLLHAARAKRVSEKGKRDRKSALNHIAISHRPKGGTTWVDGPPPKQITIVSDDDRKTEQDTGTSHPHGTRYKPEMHRYHNVGVSRTTGIEYTTTVLEAIGVEHKETTRNYDILAAVFTDVVKYMHDDFDLVD